MCINPISEPMQSQLGFKSNHHLKNIDIMMQLTVMRQTHNHIHNPVLKCGAEMMKIWQTISKPCQHLQKDAQKAHTSEWNLCKFN